MVCRAHSFPFVRFAVAVGVALVLASCASLQQTVGGWFGAATPAPSPAPETRAAQAPRVYYAGADELKVYSEPSASSKVVGSLSLHEKVTRTKLERGYAYVEGAKSGVKGWVINAQLLWRLPSAPTTAAPAPVEEQPEEPVAPAGEEAQTPAAPEATATAPEPRPTNTPVPTAPGIAPSIFNPY